MDDDSTELIPLQKHAGDLPQKAKRLHWPDGTWLKISGRIIAIEKIPYVVVHNFEQFSFHSDLFGTQARLCWFGGEFLVPVLVAKWYSNQDVGSTHAFGGTCERFCGLACVRAPNLFGQS
jgi:hypothetical protein